MKLERWVLPPAIAAAVFTAVAIVPPGGPLARGLRVESLGGPGPGVPFVARVTNELAGSAQWRAPASVDVTLRGATGDERRAHVTGSRISAFAFFSMPSPSSPPYALRVRADAMEALVSIPAERQLEFVRGAVQAPAERGVEVVVEGGSLVPEIPGAVFVHLDGMTNGPVGVATGDPSLEISARQVTLDACGVGMIEATLHGFDARLDLTIPGTPAQVVHRRLPVTPGGLSVAPAPNALTVRAPIANQTAYVAAGDASRPLTWSALEIPDTTAAFSEAQAAFPAEAAWALASWSPAFDDVRGIWLRNPPVEACVATEAGRRFARASVGIPELPPVRVLFDGASFALRSRQQRQHRARVVALGLAASAIALLVTLVLAATLSGNSSELREIATSTSRRLAWAIGASAVLLVGGFVLLLTFALRI